VKLRGVARFKNAAMLLVVITHVQNTQPHAWLLG
jgi:hypothetical protein